MSLEHLRAWLPWAMTPPEILGDTQSIIEQSASRFSEGSDFMYTIFSSGDSEVYGGAGIHPRAEPGCVELGYWIRADQTGKGYATEAVAALTKHAFGISGVTRAQIDCDPRNTRSIRVPIKLGFRRVELLRANKVTPTGEPRDTIVFELSESERLAEHSV